MTLDTLLARCAPFLLALGLTSCATPRLPVEAGVAQELARHRAAALADIRYRLHLALPVDTAADIPGRLQIEFALSDAGEDLQLDFRAEPARLQSVAVNGRASAWRFENEHLVIPHGELHSGANSIAIEFLAGDTSLNRNPDYLYTLFVPDRARTAFPLFDQPDLKAVYELSLELPADWEALSSAPAARLEESGDRKTVWFRPSDPMSSYLFSFVAGRFVKIVRTVDGREMTLLHRETDPQKLARNLDEIFRLHAASLDWLEEYTGIPYPFQSFGLVLIPAFQYSGMEHPGAIQYRAAQLLLDEAPSTNELLGRASLIAHETAHMWFGDLVTMRWFDDVWTKEVYANFMADKMVIPQFPQIDHDLNFLVRHLPSAYAVDRTAGANAIRQPLPNLNEAGQLYGPIIYDKAPVMMRQLEMLVGEDAFRAGLREYLARFAFANASWPELIAILDAKTPEDLATWSDVWVGSAGRPEFRLSGSGAAASLCQSDPAGQGRLWPQRFDALALHGDAAATHPLLVDAPMVALPFARDDVQLLLNAGGRGYGLFPVAMGILDDWERLPEVSRASALVQLYEQLLAGDHPAPLDYLQRLQSIVETEDNQLVLHLALQQLSDIFWTLLPGPARENRAPALEDSLWRQVLAREEPSQRKLYFDAYAGLALTPAAVWNVYDVWSGNREIADLPLSERDRIRLAQLLAIKRPGQAEDILRRQLADTANPDEARRLAFIAPSVSADPAVRDAFFAALAREENRRTESWVLDALENLHHPLRTGHSERYIRPSLDLLVEIQATGDIFFPAAWISTTLANYNSASAVRIVDAFLAEHPDYNRQLRMKILQAADPMQRAERILATAAPGG